MWVLCLVAFEVALTNLIIWKVPYTEIDWIAYMQEVAGVLSGERNYSNLKGDTGPLVYPAGFVYVYAAFLWFTDAQVAADGTYQGSDVRQAQFAFGVLYLAMTALVLAIYLRASPRMPPLALCLLCASKRIHSIFVLRLFNDGIAILLAYAAILLFAQRRWRWGCVFYSLGVSVKMNVLLFAPGLLLLLLQAHASLIDVAVCLTICASIQVVLAMPFLMAYPVEYFRGAFDLGRVFMFKWTVNWKFLPEEVFTGKPLAVALLALTLSTWAFFFFYKWPATATNANIAAGAKKGAKRTDLAPSYIVYTLFVSNFVGVVFARTLHYQFYSWYFHQIPLLAWASPSLPVVGKLLVSAGIEYAFNVYPATPQSSAILQASHLLLLAVIAFSKVPNIYSDRIAASTSSTAKKQSKLM